MELAEIRTFIGAHEPFASLSGPELAKVVASTSIQYFRRGVMIVDAGQENGWLSLIRSGAVELRLGGSDLLARLGEGDCFGYPSLLRNGPTQNRVTALEDCLLYRIPKPLFMELHRQSPAFALFFTATESQRLRHAVERLTEAHTAPDTQMAAVFAPLKDIIRRAEVISATATDSIAEAARIMTQHDVSTLLVYQDGQLAGIVTDKDLRRRVLGAGLATSAPLAQIMTASPLVISGEVPIFTALLMMLDRHIHHLPVVDGKDQVIGIVGASDLLARMGSNTLQIANRIRQATQVNAVARATALLPQALVGLVGAGVDADHVGRFVSSIGEQAHSRLLALAEADLGPPPLPYALICFGSLARNEQALGSDQDNGFVFGADYEPAHHDAYFSELARRLCDGLDQAGYVFCPGNIMASNPRQRLSVAGWLKNFEHWIRSPDPEAVLNSTIFFDMRAVAGDLTLVDDVRDNAFALARKNNIFQAFVARSAAGTRIPLGFFRNLLLERDAVEGDVLDLKKQAIAPIVDIARAHALRAGITVANTLERLAAAGAEGSLRAESAADLRDCFEFIRDVRFRHQCTQISAGQKPSNKLSPQSLSRFDREHLRDSFKIIREQLDNLRTLMAGGMT